MSSTEDPNPSLTSLQFLMRLQDGQLLQEFQTAIEDVVQGVILTSKVGEIDLKITVDVVKNAPGAVFFKAKLKEKVPQLAKQVDILYVGNQGSLHENNPRQREMQYGPRPVPTPVPGRDFDIATGETASPRAS